MTDIEIFEAIKQLQGGIRSIYFTRNDIAQILGTSNKKVGDLFEVYSRCVLHANDVPLDGKPKILNWKDRAYLDDFDACYISISSHAQHACLAVSVQMKNELVAIWDLIKKGGRFENELKHCQDIYWAAENMDKNDIDFVTYIHDNFGTYLTELPDGRRIGDSEYANYKWYF